MAQEKAGEGCSVRCGLASCVKVSIIVFISSGNITERVQWMSRGNARILVLSTDAGY